MDKLTAHFCWLVLLGAVAALADTSESALQVYTRATHSLNGEWKIIVDPYENGYYN